MVSPRFRHQRPRLLDCEIPEEKFTSGVTGLRGPLSCLNQARYGIGWGAIGAGHGLLRHRAAIRKNAQAIRHKPIASHQLVQEKLAWMNYRNRQSAAPRLHVGRLKDAGKSIPLTSPCSK